MIGRSSLFAQVLNQIARRDFARPAGAGPARGCEARQRRRNSVRIGYGGL